MTPGEQPDVILNKTRLFAKFNTPLSRIMKTINVSVHQTCFFVVFYLLLVQIILNYLKTEKSTRKSKAGREFYDTFSSIYFLLVNFTDN